MEIHTDYPPDDRQHGASTARVGSSPLVGNGLVGAREQTTPLSISQDSAFRN